MRHPIAALFGLFCISCNTLAAPAAPKERSAVQLEHMMNKRHQIQALSGPEASQAQLKTAASGFEGLLAELNQPAMRDLANGSNYLRFERLNNLLPLAAVYSRLGLKEQALTAIEASQYVGWFPDLGAMLDKDPDFAILKDEPRLREIRARAAIGGRIFDSAAIATTFRDTLSVEERIAGLSLFWHEARQNFVHFDHVPELEWDKVYLDHIAKVIDAKSTRDYYDVLMRLAPLLQDGHTNIYPPRELIETFYARPPVRTALIEDKVMVLSVDNPALDKLLAAGDEILAIDGMAVKTYATQRVAPYVSSSTPQDRLVRTYSYQLLGGLSTTPVVLTLAGADGSTREVTLARSGYANSRKRPAFEFKMLENSIAYIAIDHFENDASIKAFEKALPQIMRARGLVIDVRQNGGGSTEYGHQILRHLTNQPIRGAASFIRMEDGLNRAQHGNFVRWVALDTEPESTVRKQKTFEGAVAVLAGPRTFSAGEDFLLAFDLLKRGIIVGEATGGSTGQPMSFALPGGGSARICIKRDVYPDGRAFVGKGISPHIESRQTVDAVRHGKDLVLAKALDEIGARVK